MLNKLYTIQNHVYCVFLSLYVDIQVEICPTCFSTMPQYAQDRIAQFLVYKNDNTRACQMNV